MDVGTVCHVFITRGTNWMNFVSKVLHVIQGFCIFNQPLFVDSVKTPIPMIITHHYDRDQANIKQ